MFFAEGKNKTPLSASIICSSLCSAYLGQNVHYTYENMTLCSYTTVCDIYLVAGREFGESQDTHVWSKLPRLNRLYLIGQQYLNNLLHSELHLWEGDIARQKLSFQE